MSLNAKVIPLNRSDRSGFLLSKGFRQIGDTNMYKIDLPNEGNSLVIDINYNVWFEYWFGGKIDQSISIGQYDIDDIKTLLSVLLKNK